MTDGFELQRRPARGPKRTTFENQASRPQVLFVGKDDLPGQKYLIDPIRTCQAAVDAAVEKTETEKQRERDADEAV